MGVPEMRSCCGFSLKHGTIIIGIVHSFFAFKWFILITGLAIYPLELIKPSDPSVLPEVTTLKIIFTIIAVVSALQCLSSIIIIFGAATNRPSLLMPWLILSPMALFVLVVGIQAGISYYGRDKTAFNVGHILTTCAVSLIVVYNILIVYSLRQHLKRLNF